jgi:hypothetical protein
MHSINAERLLVAASLLLIAVTLTIGAAHFLLHIETLR